MTLKRRRGGQVKMAKRREIPRLRRPILRLRSGQAIRFANGGRNRPAPLGMTEGGAGACRRSRWELQDAGLPDTKRRESPQTGAKPGATTGRTAQGVSLRSERRHEIASVHGQARRIQAKTPLRPDAGAVRRPVEAAFSLVFFELGHARILSHAAVHTAGLRLAPSALS